MLPDPATAPRGRHDVCGLHVTSPGLAKFIDMGDECDRCQASRWPKSVEYLDAQWLSATYRCKPCGRSWSVGWPTNKENP